MALAKAHAEVARARARLEAAREEREGHMEEARRRVTGDGVSAASLLLISDALVAGRRQVDAAEGDVDRLAKPVNDARAALDASTRARRVAENLLERRLSRDRMEREGRLQREQDDLSAQRTRAG